LPLISYGLPDCSNSGRNFERVSFQSKS